MSLFLRITFVNVLKLIQYRKQSHFFQNLIPLAGSLISRGSGDDRYLIGPEGLYRSTLDQIKFKTSARKISPDPGVYRKPKRPTVLATTVLNPAKSSQSRMAESLFQSLIGSSFKLYL